MMKPAIQELSDWVIEQGLAGTDLNTLVTGLCERMQAHGLPLWRVHVSMTTLHPSFSAFGCTWYRGSGAHIEHYTRGLDMQERWQQSPLRKMVDENVLRLRRRLIGPDAQLDFPLLIDFRDRGASDWLALLTRFGAAQPAITLPGMISTWTTDRPDGFTDQELSLIERLAPRLALACYRITLQEVAEGLLDAYVGADAGRHILGGQIVRGATQELSAALFLADLRGFTRAADSLPGRDLLAMLNDRLGAITDAIEARGGQVLKFLGDGLLAVFDLEGRPVEAVCGDALDAAEDAQAANAVLQRLHGPAEDSALDLDIALHLGDLLYGNVGSERRLDFTVIGPAVNEVSRIEALCEPLGQPLLLSEHFAHACGREVVSVGEHQLRGVAQAQELFTLG